MAKKSWKILFDSDGNMLEQTEKSRHGRYVIQKVKVQELPGDTEMALELKLKYIGHKGWWNLETPDGRKFIMSDSEAGKMIPRVVIDHSHFSGIFSFTRKGVMQSLVWEREIDEDFIDSNTICNP